MRHAMRSSKQARGTTSDLAPRVRRSARGLAEGHAVRRGSIYRRARELRAQADRARVRVIGRRTAVVARARAAAADRGRGRRRRARRGRRRRRARWGLAAARRWAWRWARRRRRRGRRRGRRGRGWRRWAQRAWWSRGGEGGGHQSWPSPLTYRGTPRRRPDVSLRHLG